MEAKSEQTHGKDQLRVWLIVTFRVHVHGLDWGLRNGLDGWKMGPSLIP